MGRTQYQAYFRGDYWTALSGGGFDRCPVDNSQLFLFPRVGVTSLGRLIFRPALSLDPSEGVVEGLSREGGKLLGERAQWRGGGQYVRNI